MDDVVDTEFKRKRDAGVLLNHEMDSLVYRCSGKPHSNVYLQYSAGSSTGSNSTVSNPTLAPSSVLYSLTSITSRANTYFSGIAQAAEWEIDAAHTSVSAALSEGIANSLVSIAEGPKTIAMIRKAANLLRHPITTARKLLKISRKAYQDQPGARKQVLDLANQMWLEGRYGWRPFVGDVVNHIEALRSGERPLRYSARRTVPGETLEPDIYIGKYATSTYFWFNKTDKVKAVYKCRVGQTVDYSVDLKTGAVQFGAYDPIGTAWDLVPFSFVVDWFINLGDVLKSFQIFLMADERIGWTMYEKQLEILHEFVLNREIKIVPGKYGPVVWSVNPSSYADNFTETCTWKTREPYTDFLPSFGFGSGMDVLKAVDAIALLRAVFGKR
jgi:hypothetical protein